eukprot:3605147-Alexandrium_andersonii.AAC.1
MPAASLGAIRTLGRRCGQGRRRQPQPPVVPGLRSGLLAQWHGLHDRESSVFEDVVRARDGLHHAAFVSGDRGSRLLPVRDRLEKADALRLRALQQPRP